MVLLDEPTRGLDYPGKARAGRRSCARWPPTGRAVVLATHDVEFVAEVADRVVVLAEGEVVADGPTAEVVVASPGVRPAGAKVLGAPWLTVDQVVAHGGRPMTRRARARPLRRVPLRPRSAPCSASPRSPGC